LCRQHGIDILTEAHAAYPRALREIHDRPTTLRNSGNNGVFFGSVAKSVASVARSICRP
jgi:hypothetical protein